PCSTSAAATVASLGRGTWWTSSATAARTSWWAPNSRRSGTTVPSTSRAARCRTARLTVEGCTPRRAAAVAWVSGGEAGRPARPPRRRAGRARRPPPPVHLVHEGGRAAELGARRGQVAGPGAGAGCRQRLPVVRVHLDHPALAFRHDRPDVLAVPLEDQVGRL